MIAEELPGPSVRPLPLGGWLILFVLLFAGNLYQAAFAAMIANTEVAIVLGKD